MVSKKKSSKKGNKKAIKEDLYNEDDLDPNSEEFLYDDIDQYHQNQEKILLSEGSLYKPKTDFRTTEEVLDVASDSDDDDERIEEYENRLKQLKRSGNYEALGSDIASDEGEAKISDDDLMSDADDDQLEEHEALLLQKQLNNFLDEDDFGISMLKNVSDNQLGLDKVGKNLSELSKKEKIILLKSESPELFKLIDELKSQLMFALKFCSDNVNLRDRNKLMYLKLLLDYCLNLSFYLALKFKREDVTNHPVIERICYFRDMFKSLSSKGSMVDDNVDSQDTRIAPSFIEKLGHVIEPNVTDDETIYEENRRAIDKTIEKNRGLTPHRKKENKNPRVKHRNKYRKAKIRRKGQIREPRKELIKYEGEISGIKAGIKGGRKLK